MAERRRFVTVLAGFLAVVLAGVSPASGDLGPGDITGDITPPVVHSLTLTPAAADVTSSDGIFNAEARVTDDLSGIPDGVFLDWTVPGNANAVWSGYLTRSSGDGLDGVYAGTLTVKQYSPVGDYPLTMKAWDRVGNLTTLSSADLQGRGWPSVLHITDANPDATAPSVTAVRVKPATVDVRGGPSQVTVEIDAADSQSGVEGISLFMNGPDYSAGGSRPPIVQRVSGTEANGTWSGTATIPQYAPAGRWRLTIMVLDHLINVRRLEPDQLAAAGLVSGFDVLSDEDSQPPALVEFSMNPIEVNVHDADQTVDFRLRMTDDKSGVGSQFEPPYQENFVSVVAIDDLRQQYSATPYMPRASGDSLDGVYEASMTVFKSSATGLRRLEVQTTDAVDNWAVISGTSLLTAGGVPTLLVYNTPLPPIPLGADPLDGGASVRWDPPTDSRGADVTQYVVTESPQGETASVGGDARSAVVGGLTNGVKHTFTIKAVNKAGPSDPSGALSTTPFAGAGKSGYWMLGAAGRVYPFGDAVAYGNFASGTAPAVDIEPTPNRDGYWVVDAAGRVSAFGAAVARGSASGLGAGESVTSMSATKNGGGYWLFTSFGRVLPFGNAPWLGDMSGTALNGPVLDSVPTPSGNGYYMVGSDGGVFTFGDAHYAGSMGGSPLNAPVQSLVPDPDGLGYWLVASDGGIFAMGAGFWGSMGGTPLNRPVTGMVGARNGRGYLMVAEDGGIFAFGDAPFRGSLASHPPAVPIVAVAAY
jgi:hypothetical protein